MITRKKKEEIYEMMTQNWETAQSFVFYNYEKMDNENLTEFRKIVNGAKCKAVVTKNTLFLKSAENAGIEFDKENGLRYKRNKKADNGATEQSGDK